MSADNFALTTDGTRTLGEHFLAVSERRQPIFWIALALAAVVHVGAIVGIGTSNPRGVGNPHGAADAIDVEIVDASALHKQMGMPEPAESPTANPPAPTAPPPSEQPQPEPEPEPEPEQAEQEQQPAQEQKAPAAEAVPEQEAPDAAPALPAKEAAPKLPDPAPEKNETDKDAKKPEPAPKAAEKAKPKPKPQNKQKPKTLDLSMPLDITDMPSSGSDSAQSSGVSRPPGITRSGENDRFGRDVIRALKRTMPAPMGIRGRVTIKIVLNKRGNVASVRLVQSGGNRALDGEVLFAAGQTSYPFPPKGATEADRTFLVTYIYR